MDLFFFFFFSKLTTVSSEKIFFSLHPPPKIEVRSDCIHNQYISNSCVHFFLLNYRSQNVAWHIKQKFCMDDVGCISLTKWMFWYKLLLEENGRWDRNTNFVSTWLLVPSIPLCYLQVELVLVGLLELIAIAGGFLQLLPTSPVHKPVFFCNLFLYKVLWNLQIKVIYKNRCCYYFSPSFQKKNPTT